MSSSNFFYILKLLEKYTYLHKEDGKILFKSDGATTNETANERIFIIDENQLQTNFRKPNWKEYSYFFFQSAKEQLKPFAKVHAFLQGAIIDKKISEAPDQAFVDYQKKVLKLQFGMFTFIDPTISQDAEEQKPYYLLGPMVGKLLQPSFNFKFYYNVENFRGNDEFIEPPGDWLRFFLAFNEFSRDAVTFYKQDFVKIFNYKKYEEKRNETIERANNILYISSGEMDTCILQWLFLYLKSSNRLRNTDNILDSRFSIDLKQMYEKISEFYSNNEEANYIIPNYRPEAKVFKTPPKKFYTWLQLWGLLNTDGLPSERLLAAFEWLYYYLKLFETEENGKYYDYRKYLTLVEIDQKDPTYHYLQGIDSKIRNKYFTAIEALLPVQLNYEWSLNTGKEDDFEKLTQLYFEILFSWDERNIEIEKASANSWEVFAERCRFRPFVHFLYRNFPSSVDHSFIEKTCRGFIAFPILSSHKSYAGDLPDRNTKPNDIHYVGYFLGHFKDSDSKGRCLFNWHKNTDYNVSETVKSIYEDNFFELRQIINQLGRIEREQIYFRGIVRMHQEEAKKQAIHSAVAACMSRNLSHTTGSHKSPWFKNYFNSFFKEIIQFYKENMYQLPDGIASGLRSIKGVGKLKDISKEKKEEEIANLQNHLLNYFDFVNDNMEFIADVTTSYNANKVTFSYSIKDIYEEYGSLKLMHHGLFDDKKMEVSIKLTYHEDLGNKYKNAVVALPNGQLGKTAFFIIIENILRNYYKHTTHENNEPKFFIRITPSSLMPDDFWCVDFYDLIAKDENKQKRTAELLNRINGDFIENSILQANGTLRREGWGFIEMKACAAYLVNFPIENIDQEADENEPILIGSTERFHSLIKANYYSNEGTIVDPQQDHVNRNLGYRFYLKKAKEIGIEEALINSDQAQYLKANLGGVDVLKNDALSETQHDILILQSIKDTVDLNQRVIVDSCLNVNK